MEQFSALWTQLDDANKGTTSLQLLPFSTLKSDEVLIRVAYSSLNYKDALSANGHKGITRNFPHIPGIDAAGTVLSDTTGTFERGEEVLVTGFDLGMNTHGGLSEYICVPANWLVKKPSNLSLHSAMQWGTAGVTAAMAIDQLQKNDILPSKGPLLISGATGGVGMIAIKLANYMGFEVHAMTRKKDQIDFLKALGASEVLLLDDFMADTQRALYPQKYAGAIDTLGGEVLVKMLKCLQNAGAVAACGMAKDVELALQIYPFILRGAKLLGIYSADSPLEYKQYIWNLIANQWQVNLAEISKEISLDEAPGMLQNMLNGQSFGRTIVCINS